MVFKKIEDRDIIRNKEVEVNNKLFGESAIIKKDNNEWNYDESPEFEFEPSLKGELYFVDDSFYVTYGSDNINNYSEYLPWNMIMSSIQAPWDAENKQYNFYVQGERVSEMIAISINPDKFNDKVGFNNFAVIVHDDDSGFVDLDGNGDLQLGHIAFAPYFVKSSLGDTSIDEENQRIKHSNRITPAYDVRTSDNPDFFNFNDDVESIHIDWDVGNISDQVGVFYPSLGLMLIFPELLTDGQFSSFKNTIDTSSNKALTSLNSIMMVMGYGVTKKVRTVVFTRLYNDEFNRTTNPTSFTLVGGEPRTEEYLEEEQMTFPTKIGYYNDQNELLAVANFSQPFKKSPEEEMIIISNIEE